MFSFAAISQTEIPSPGQLTPNSFAPRLKSTLGSFTFPEAGVAPPLGSESIYLDIRDVALDGLNPEMADEIAPIVAELRGKNVSVTSVYQAVARIEQAYAKRGYFLTRVVVPPQKVTGKNSTIRFSVVDGFIEAIDVAGLDPNVRERVASITSPLIHRARLTRGELERALLLAGDVPGLDLKSTLSTGQAIGSVRLALSGNYRPVTVEVSANNSLAHSLGRTTATTTATFNSIAGFGEQLYVSASDAPGYRPIQGYNPRRLLASGLLVPLGNDGWSGNIETAWSKTNPLREVGGLDTLSEFKRWSFRLNDALIKTRTDSVTTRVLMDIVSEAQTAPAVGQNLYDDRLTIMRGGLDASHMFDTGTQISGSFDVSQGLHGLGSRSRSDATLLMPISRALAEDVFTKFEGRLRLHHDFASGFGADVTGRAQYAASGPLRNSERFSIGGPADLSAYDASSFSGDHGWMVRGELQYALPINLNVAVTSAQFYAFTGRGQVMNREPTAVELAVNGASNYGVGVRGTLNFGDAKIRSADYGIEVGQQRNDNTSVAPNSWRLNFNTALRF